MPARHQHYATKGYIFAVIRRSEKMTELPPAIGYMAGIGREWLEEAQ